MREAFFCGTWQDTRAYTTQGRPNMRGGMLKRFDDFYARSGLSTSGLLLARGPGGGYFAGYTRSAIGLGLPVLAVALIGATGCKVQVDKSEDGKNVRIATPFGTIAVNKNQASASDVGLPAYPGSALDTGEDGNKSAKVDMGLGSWKLRVRMAHYTTTDNRDQVLAFYRKALGEYGSVIECAGDTPVGTPATTREGLNCDHSDHGNNSMRGNFNSNDLELKAGSPHQAHSASRNTGPSGPTRMFFGLTSPCTSARLFACVAATRACSAAARSGWRAAVATSSACGSTATR